MNNRHDPRPVPPEKPLPTDCCGSGCAVCVNDAYQEELDDHEARLASWRARNRDVEEAGVADDAGNPGRNDAGD